MLSRNQGLIAAVLGVVLAGVLFVVLSGGEDERGDPAPETSATTQPASGAYGSSPPAGQGGKGPEREPKPAEPELPLIEIRDGQPVGGVAELEFESGTDAEFGVEADAADELHLHGYDLYIDVGPGEPRQVSFAADIEGVFELESHTTAVPIAEISVTPG